MKHLKKFDSYTFEDFTHTDMEDVKDLLEEGLTVEQIADELDFDISKVEQIISSLKKSQQMFDEYKLEDLDESFNDKFILEEFDIDGYESHWSKFKNWLSEKDFDFYDGEEELCNKFMEIANDDNFSSEEKADHICSYLEDKWGLYDGYNDTWDYLELLFMDEI